MLRPVVAWVANVALIILAVIRSAVAIRTDGFIIDDACHALNIVLAENYAFHAPYFLKTPELYDASIRGNLQQGSKVSATAYIQSRRELNAARPSITTVFSKVDGPAGHAHDGDASAYD